MELKGLILAASLLGLTGCVTRYPIDYNGDGKAECYIVGPRLISVSDYGLPDNKSPKTRVFVNREEFKRLSTINTNHLPHATLRGSKGTITYRQKVEEMSELMQREADECLESSR